MPKTVILSAARTPIGKLGGSLASLDAAELGGIAINAALERAEVAPEQVQHVVMGQVLQAGQGQIPSRQAQINAGIPKEVSSETINKVCASGVRAVGMLDAAIRAGDLEVGVAGGMESMSNAPYLLKDARFGDADGRRQGARRDDPRRPHEPVLRQAHGAGGERGGGRARDDARRHGPLGAALARAARSRRPTRAVCRRRSCRSRSTSRKGDTVVEVDEAPRGTSRSRRSPSCRRSSWRTAATRPATRRASTTAPARWCVASDEWARANDKSPAGDGRRPGAGRRRLRLPRADAGERGAEGARRSSG